MTLGPTKILRREAVEPDARKAMTPARMKRIWLAHDGLCWRCGKPVPMRGAAVRYDHKLLLFGGGKELDENVGPSHTWSCDKVKTAKDAKTASKIRRQQKMGDPRPPSPLKGRGFQKGGPKQKIASRGFPKRER